MKPGGLVNLSVCPPVPIKQYGANLAALINVGGLVFLVRWGYENRLSGIKMLLSLIFLSGHMQLIQIQLLQRFF